MPRWWPNVAKVALPADLESRLRVRVRVDCPVSGIGRQPWHWARTDSRIDADLALADRRIPNLLRCARTGFVAAQCLYQEETNIMEQRLEQLLARRVDTWALRVAITDQMGAREHLTVAETASFNAYTAQLAGIDQRIAQVTAEIERSGLNNPNVVRIRNLQDRGATGGWASRAATALIGGAGEARAVTSGNIDLPTLVEPSVSAKPRPGRLIDLLVTRQAVESPAFEYLRQSVRTNNAAVVADYGDKPTSVNTTVPVQDSVRVVAHISEDVPIRYWLDHSEVVDWLQTEMVEGVLDALEAQVIAGSGTGINMTGLLTVAGTTAVAYATDVPTTLRKAITALQVLGVAPTAWVLNPADAEAIDLLRYESGGDDAVNAGYLLDGFSNGIAGSANVFGGSDIQRVISNSIPAGVAVLGDWSKIKLYIRDATNLVIDAGGDNFTNNTARIRAEGRFGVGHLMPSSFAKVDLTA
jgi:HK97 family phage major capsid protein